MADAATDDVDERGGTHFARTLGIITGLGLAVRVGYVLLFTRYENSTVYDAVYYGVESSLLAHGHFFVAPFVGGPDAAHPPLTALVLTPSSYLFGTPTGSTPQRLTMALLGAVVVLCVGLLGRSVAGPRVGLIAAALAACAPNFWLPNGILMSETVSMLLMAVILILVYRLLRAPTWGNAAWLGVAVAAEVLTRAELVLLLPFLVLPAVLLCRRVTLAGRLRLLAVVLLVSGAVVAPWVIRNLVTFHDATYISTGDGNLLLGANCDRTYSGPNIGTWRYDCQVQIPNGGEQSVLSTRRHQRAVTYISHHLDRFPLVAAARVGRLWDVYAPDQMAHVDVYEGRPYGAAIAGLVAYYLLVPIAVAGIVIARRRRLVQWPLLVPAGVLTIVAVYAYGTPRFRAPFEVSLVVLAAIAVDAAVARLRREAHATGGSDTGPTTFADPAPEPLPIT
ncbi:MAG: glycosyl transferase, family 39 [Actinomycetia bacterium]|nr:glycosyl transferase, family 39 [Actinomycetes bacterium]